MPRSRPVLWTPPPASSAPSIRFPHSFAHHYADDSSSSHASPASTNLRVNHGPLPYVRHASSGDQSRAKPTKFFQCPQSPRTPPQKMRLLSSGKLLYYLRDIAETDLAVAACKDKLKGPLGFDIEYRPNFIKGCPENRTALVQLAAESVIFLVQVSAMTRFPDTIRHILEDHTIVKSGVGIKGDAAKLRKDFGIHLASCIELGYLARAVDKQWANSSGLISLARLVKAYEARDLKKRKSIQLSNWELLLSEEQQDYAAADADSSLRVLQTLYTALPAVEPAPSEDTYLFYASGSHT